MYILANNYEQFMNRNYIFFCFFKKNTDKFQDKFTSEILVDYLSINRYNDVSAEDGMKCVHSIFHESLRYSRIV